MTTDLQQRRFEIKRGKYAVSLDPRAVARIDELVGAGQFRSRSHGLDEALRRMISEIDSEQKSANDDD